MAELDYAFVADYARVEGGKLTVVGASFTHLEAQAFPAAHLVSVAGRIRAQATDEPVMLRVSFESPGRQFALGVEAQLSPDSARPYADGRVGLLFAMTLPVQLPVEGLYEVLVDIDGDLARRLAFDVSRRQERT